VSLSSLYIKKKYEGTRKTTNNKAEMIKPIERVIGMQSRKQKHFQKPHPHPHSSSSSSKMPRNEAVKSPSGGPKEKINGKKIRPRKFLISMQNKFGFSLN